MRFPHNCVLVWAEATGAHISIIGHITKDTLEYRGKIPPFTGGAAYFSAFAARRSNAKICVVTKLAKRVFVVLDALKKEGIEVIAFPSPQTTSIENVFESDDPDKRKVRLISQADPFQPEDIPKADAKMYYLAGLFVGEIPGTLIEYLAGKGEIGLDLQAMLRSNEGGSYSFKDWILPTWIHSVASPMMTIPSWPSTVMKSPVFI